MWNMVAIHILSYSSKQLWRTGNHASVSTQFVFIPIDISMLYCAVTDIIKPKVPTNYTWTFPGGVVGSSAHLPMTHARMDTAMFTSCVHVVCSRAETGGKGSGFFVVDED